ncbi:MAG: O-antigen ligase family protein [Candidatus Omnitrophica bacterium]|nr:O-antigen ligase family protein [Candidatus Omnitrophota bacterium]MDD5591953.1 O-antigen ligase family protein [Candidatus Omnitrophota bacterium]
MPKIIKYLDCIIYWSIVLMPFSMAISPVPVSVFEGFLIFSFFTKKLLKKERIFSATVINIPLLLLFAITCLSVINSINYFDTLKGGIFKLLRYIFIFFIVSEEARDAGHIRKIVFSVTLGIILASFDGIWQVATGRDFIRGYAPVLNIGLVRATAAFKDSNLLGIYLSALAPLVFGLMLYYYRKGKKALMLLASFIALVGIALTYSRPTLLAIYIALFFLGIARKDKKMVIFLIVILLIVPFILPRSVKDWAKLVDNNPLRFMCNDDRIAVYRNSLNMIKAHPFIGLGANTYMKNYKYYREPVEYRGVVTKDYMYAHNNFLHMASEIGLIGLGIFIWLLYKLFRQCGDIYKRLKDGYLRIVFLSLSACLIAFLVNGLTESSLYYSRVAVIFWYMAGLSLGFKKFIYADT